MRVVSVVGKSTWSRADGSGGVPVESKEGLALSEGAMRKYGSSVRSYMWRGRGGI